MNELEALSRGDTDRLMVQMPPGSAKSTYTSILFPAWWFTRHPRDSIIAASHTAGLATYFGRRARSIIDEEAPSLGYNISVRDRANSHWSTSLGGEYYAIGIRGALIGRRADLAIIDDPVKSQAEADSLIHRDRLWDWYRSDLIPRLKPKARIILIMTRWHQDDLCGRLLEHDAEEWRCLTLPALAEEGDQLNRPLGEPIWPEWEDIPGLLRRRTSVGQRAWLAQYQQSPRPEAGTLFKVGCLEFIDWLPPGPPAPVVRAWDLAATATTGRNDPDWTVGVKLTRHDSGRYTVLDVMRLRGSPREVEDSIVTAARADGRGVTIGLPVDPGQAGKSQTTYLTSQLAGYHVVPSRETGAKATRAAPVASQIEGGNVSLFRANWNHAFIEELRDFPFGRKDDQVDALSRAFTMLLDIVPPSRTLTVPHMAR
ncbi:MAG: phage terminase large subunit [Acetobacteraceae bacterium]|jgi:predicted phage terminase large subunit-like protein